MATTTISSKFKIVIPKEVREKLHLSPRQRLYVVEKGGVITLVPEGAHIFFFSRLDRAQFGHQVPCFMDLSTFQWVILWSDPA